MGLLREDADDPALVFVSMGEEEPDVYWEAIEGCVSAEDFAIVGGSKGRGPDAYGDDPRLDSMQDDCEAGEMRACDLLFLSTRGGTDYEEVALSCGGTTEVSDSFCSPDPELDETGFAPADSPGLTDLAGQCKDGDPTSCDLLYLIETSVSVCFDAVTGQAFADAAGNIVGGTGRLTGATGTFRQITVGSSLFFDGVNGFGPQTGTLEETIILPQ